MAGVSTPEPFPTATIIPLGDSGLLVRFGTTLTDQANRAAISLAARLVQQPIAGVVEVVPNLVSVLLRYEPLLSPQATIAGELRLRLSADQDVAPTQLWSVPVRFDGPDLAEVAAALKMNEPAFVAAHNARALRVLATGFAPGFVYCGLHGEHLALPRRTSIRPVVPPGSVLFAAGQTAIAATEMPTGWHVIGHTSFVNFDQALEPPTRMSPGDMVTFEALG